MKYLFAVASATPPVTSLPWVFLHPLDRESLLRFSSLMRLYDEVRQIVGTVERMWGSSGASQLFQIGESSWLVRHPMRAVSFAGLPTGSLAHCRVMDVDGLPEASAQDGDSWVNGISDAGWEARPDGLRLVCIVDNVVRVESALLTWTELGVIVDALLPSAA